MPRGVPKPKETMADLMARFVAPEAPKSAMEMANERPRLRAAYDLFKMRRKKNASTPR